MQAKPADSRRQDQRACGAPGRDFVRASAAVSVVGRGRGARSAVINRAITTSLLSGCP